MQVLSDNKLQPVINESITYLPKRQCEGSLCNFNEINSKSDHRTCTFVIASTPEISKIFDDTKNSQTKNSLNFLEPYDTDFFSLNRYQNVSAEGFLAITESITASSSGVADPCHSEFLTKNYSEVFYCDNSKINSESPQNSARSHFSFGNDSELFYHGNDSENSYINFENTAVCMDIDTPAELSPENSIYDYDHGLRDGFYNDEFQKIKEIKQKHVKNITLGYININSIRNKFNDLKLIVKDYIDILIIAETKIDASFPINQFNQRI